MELLSQLTVHRTSGDAIIQLLLGDITALPEEYAVDLLVVSAFPGDYTPVDGTIIGSLHRKGISVASLADHKEADLTTQLGCWLSAPVDQDLQYQLHFERILCFESGHLSSKTEELVGNIFRCINTFAFNEAVSSVALPIVATGNQRGEAGKVFAALLDAAIFWLENDLPLNFIRFCVIDGDDADTAKNIFREKRTAYQKKLADTRDLAPAAAAPPPPRYDYFISYAHVHTSEVEEFVKAMKEKNQGLRIFYDRSSIPAGGQWIRLISDAIQQAESVICVLSPQYSKSDVCWDEFQCAKLKEYRLHKPVIKTVYLYSDKDLPPIMGIYSYIDCTEGDLQKFRSAAQQIS
jgi:hypothetical protein